MAPVLRKLGYSYSYLAEGGRHLFKKNSQALTLQESNPVFQINHFGFRFVRFPVERNGKLSLASSDLIFLTNALRRTEEKSMPLKTNTVPEVREPKAEPKKPDIFSALATNALPDKYLKSTNSGRIDAIFLDPGHGGIDPGAVAFSFYEKDLALRSSVAVRNALTNRLPEVSVTLLRTKDEYMSLEDRCRIANAKLRRDQNGIFVSIHLNTWFDPAARGFEVYYLSHQGWSENARVVALAENRVFQIDQTNLKGLDPFEKIFGRLEVIQYQRESKMIAENVSFAVYNSIKDYVVNRGVKSERFYVLKGALMPSVLIEVGFVSSKEDLIYLNEDEKMNTMADAVAKGIEQYVRDFNQSRGFTEELF